MPVVIETPRLLLRTWEPSDRPALVTITSEPEITRWLNLGEPFSDEDVDAFLSRQADTYALRGWCRWACELRDPSADDPAGPVGFCGYGCAFAPDVELGWTLLPAVWGRGLATEAARAALAYGFEAVGFPAVVSAILPENARSRRVAEKLGETVDGALLHDGLRHLRYRIENPHAPSAAPPPGIRRDCL